MQPNLFKAKAKGKLNNSELIVTQPQNPEGFTGLVASAETIIPTIFKKNVKKNSKLRPFNKSICDVGGIQYFPAWSKEWRNSVYHFNSNLIKNLPVYDLNIVKVIRSYFNAYFNHQFLKYNYIQPRIRRLSFNKIFFARPEIKHTNSKAIVTLYTYNREKIALNQKKDFVHYLFWRLLCLLQSGKGYSIFKGFKLKWVRKRNPDWLFWGERYWKGLGSHCLLSSSRGKSLRKWLLVQEWKPFTERGRSQGYLKKMENFFFRFNMILVIMKDKNLLQDFYAYLSALKTSKIKAKQQANKWVKIFFNREFTLLRKYKFKLNFNKYKFEEKFLNRLSNLISKIYNKQIEFNIVNMKNIVFNTDLFTEISTKKIKKRNTRVSRIMHIMLNKASLPKVNRIQEKGRKVNDVNFNLVENRYKTLNLKDILRGKLNLSKFLNKIYTRVNGGVSSLLPKVKAKLYNIVFNSIKYKNLHGIRMEVKGRLTPRYRADRSVYKVRWKGGLKNVGSSYQGLSVRKNRGHLNPNVSYSIFASKRRVGAFAVKGWTGGKG